MPGELEYTRRIKALFKGSDQPFAGIIPFSVS